ncbi:MAG: hypothetical protein KDD50_14940 [Bdellovibrionales bacterium]|nr:hypothetical protein [Bdellovibrionales bacterium]
MTQDTWITLAEYSQKYKVSQSTLRRRIKGKKVEYRFENGKYIIKNLPLSDHTIDYSFKDDSPNLKGHRSPQHQSIVSTHTHESQAFDSPSEGQGLGEVFTSEQAMPAVEKPEVEETSDYIEDSPMIASATNLLREIKKAYGLVLQEKQEQILILKDEISNLQMLVQILENENARLKQEQHIKVPELKWETELEFD